MSGRSAGRGGGSRSHAGSRRDAERHDVQRRARRRRAGCAIVRGVAAAVGATKTSTSRARSRSSASARAAVGLGELAEEQVLALQRAHDRHAELLPQPPRDAEEHRVGEVHDLGPELVAQPARPACRAPWPGDPSSPRSIDSVSAPSSRASVEPPKRDTQRSRPGRSSRRSSQRGVRRNGAGLLLQVDVDGAEEDAVDRRRPPRRCASACRWGAAPRRAPAASAPRRGCCRAGSCRSTCRRRRRAM